MHRRKVTGVFNNWSRCVAIGIRRGADTPGRSRGTGVGLGVALGFALIANVGSVRAEDWPMLGGRPDRNMVSSEKGLPIAWDAATGKNIKWSADLGEVTYGAPVISGGRVIIGTNND